MLLIICSNCILIPQSILGTFVCRIGLECIVLLAHGQARNLTHNRDNRDLNNTAAVKVLVQQVRRNTSHGRTVFKGTGTLNHLILRGSAIGCHIDTLLVLITFGHDPQSAIDNQLATWRRGIHERNITADLIGSLCTGLTVRSNVLNREAVFRCNMIHIALTHIVSRIIEIKLALYNCCCAFFNSQAGTWQELILIL